MGVLVLNREENRMRPGLVREQGAGLVARLGLGKDPEQ